MVKANELRIGNWVEAIAPMGNYNMKVYATNIEALETNPNCANPIPLTPEILEACGFVEINEFFENQKRHVIKAEDGIYTWYLDNRFIDNYIELLYLHQLQNLYFSLTGEEIEVKQSLLVK